MLRGIIINQFQYIHVTINHSTPEYLKDHVKFQYIHVTINLMVSLAAELLEDVSIHPCYY